MYLKKIFITILLISISIVPSFAQLNPVSNASSNTISFSGYDGLHQYTLGSNMDDMDMDGIPADMDNCINAANADQADIDNDMVGDVCDACPNGDDLVDVNNNNIIDDCECKEVDVTLTGMVVRDSVYVVSNNLQSEEIISGSSKVIYKAANSITLSAGFQVGTGTSFLATVVPCEAALKDLQLQAVSQTKTAGPSIGAATLALTPNPFVNNTTIHYSLPENSEISILIQNVNGQQLAILLDKVVMDKGQHTLDWSAVNLPTGIYFLAMKDGQQTQTQKMFLISE